MIKSYFPYYLKSLKLLFDNNIIDPIVWNLIKTLHYIQLIWMASCEHQCSIDPFYYTTLFTTH